MNSLEILKQIAMENKGLILTRDAIAGGVSRASLSFLCKEGRIARVPASTEVMIHHDILYGWLNRELFARQLVLL
jgi:hypothetical protein